jgi:hypothetical protein
VNSRRGFLKAVSGVAGGVVFGSAANADAKAQPLVTILHGNGTPAQRQGIVGDFYIDDRSHSIYGPKRTTGWGRPTSLIGPAGRAGPAGTSGGSGSGGTSGPPGPQGYSILHGDGPPSASTGVDNDFYIDTSTTQLYGPREGGVWGSPISLTGNGNITVIDGGSL